MNIGGIELATRGDIIVGGLSFAGGFAVDAFFFSGGATSAAAGGATMAGALGVKYAIQKMFSGEKKTLYGKMYRMMTYRVRTNLRLIVNPTKETNSSRVIRCRRSQTSSEG